MHAGSAILDSPNEPLVVFKVIPRHFQESLAEMSWQGFIFPVISMCCLWSGGTLWKDNCKRFPFLICFKSFAGEQKNHDEENKM